MTLDQVPPTPPQTRLRILDLLRAGFAALTNPPPRALRAVAGVWFVILVGASFLQWLLAPPVKELGDEAIDSSSGIDVVEVVVVIVSIAAFVDIGVKWIRLLVLDETPQGFLDTRLNRRRWSFLLRSLLLGVLMTVAMISIVAVGFIPLVLGAGTSTMVLVPLSFGGMFLIAYLGGRFGFYLVGAAIGDRRMGFSASWDATRANGMAITLAVLAASLIFLIPSIIVLLAAVPLAVILGATVVVVLLVPVVIGLNVAVYLVYGAILARAYGRLVPEPPPGTLVL